MERLPRRLRSLSGSLLGGLGLALVFAACGGGGGGGPTSPPPPPPPPAAGVTFTPGTVATSSSVSFANGTGATSSTLVLDLRATSVNDLYAVAFDVVYPSNLLRFTRADEGPFLSGGGAPTSLQVSEPMPGLLVVGLSRLGALGGVTGTGTLITFTFTSRAAGDGAFSFQRNRVLGSDGLGLPGISWGGGTVRVVL